MVLLPTTPTAVRGLVGIPDLVPFGVAFHRGVVDGAAGGIITGALAATDHLPVATDFL